MDGDTLTLSSVGNAVGGAVALDANGDVAFTPQSGFYGTATFTYTIGDGHGGSSTRSVIIDVIKPLHTIEDVACAIGTEDLLLGMWVGPDPIFRAYDGTLAEKVHRHPHPLRHFLSESIL